MSVTLATRYDAVIMLTLSDWRTEMRSNRYHYASRLARHLPVIFVQPNLDEPRYDYEDTDVRGVVMLHVYKFGGWKQCALLRQAFRLKRIVKPMLWVYNHQFLDFIASRHAPFMVYHATEDYFSPEFGLPDSSLNDLRTVLRFCDLLVAVSEGVKNSYAARGRYAGAAVVVENGCDFKFWAPHLDGVAAVSSRRDDQRIAFYQGGIHRKIDFGLLHELVRRMPTWEFWFCGEVYPDLSEWDSLCRHANVKYWGKLSPEEVRHLAHQSTVGLIPFNQNDWIIERSFPLKAFEYVACGLPVVSVPINALRPYADVIQFAASSNQFMVAMQQEAATRHDAEAIAKRLRIARMHDYDLKFDALLSANTFLPAAGSPQRKPFSVPLLRARIIARSFLNGLGTALAELKRAVALAVIHHCAWLMARMVNKHPDQLEEAFLRFGRKVKNYGR